MRKAMYLMGSLDDSGIEWLAANGAALRMMPKQVLVREGQLIDSLFIVLEGQFAVTAGSAPLATLLAGEVVGEISFVDSRPPMATVTALDAGRVLAVPREVLQGKLAGDCQFAAGFYRALAIFLSDRLRATTARLGYGRPEQDAEPEDAGEMGEELMETASLGARRFDQLLRRVRNG